MGSYYKQQLNDWVGTLEVKAHRVLDIGGSQNPIKGRTKSWDVQDYRILDLAVPHVEKQHPDIEWDMNHPIFTAGYFNSSWRDEIEEVDLIYMLGVMDYVINPSAAMGNVSYLLKSGGVAWIEFPFVYPIHEPVQEEGCRYSEGCIRRLAKQAGLEIEEIIYKRPYPYNHHLLDFYHVDGMRAARNVDHNVTGYICRMRKP